MATGKAPSLVTPGPWRLGLDENDTNSTSIWAGELIGTAYQRLRRGDPKANAQLFVAALDMYEALEAAVNFERIASENLDILVEYPLGPSPWMEKALAALAKARGE